jgi:hypothetical protein
MFRLKGALTSLLQAVCASPTGSTHARPSVPSSHGLPPTSSVSIQRLWLAAQTSRRPMSQASRRRRLLSCTCADLATIRQRCWAHLEAPTNCGLGLAVARSATMQCNVSLSAARQVLVWQASARPLGRCLQRMAVHLCTCEASHGRTFSSTCTTPEWGLRHCRHAAWLLPQKTSGVQQGRSANASAFCSGRDVLFLKKPYTRNTAW